MNTLCFLSGMTSADWAAWSQALVGTAGIVAGAVAIRWQVVRAQTANRERDALLHDGLARLLVHLKDGAMAARRERRSLNRLPPGHPSEPSALFTEVADAVRRYPLETIPTEVTIEAILNARRVARAVEPFVLGGPDLNTQADMEQQFDLLVGELETQILLLRGEADRLFKGHGHRHAARAFFTGVLGR